MPVIEAVLATERPSRYLVQFCRHASAMDRSRHKMHRGARGRHGGHRPEARAEWNDAEGVVTFTPGGRCVLTADTDGGTLTIRIEADDQDALGSLREIVSRDFTRFGLGGDQGPSWVPVPPG
jgi:hypothetical protein